MSSQVRIQVKDLAISETGFVFDPFSGGTFTLNATGQFIVKALREGLTTSEIVARMSAEFDAVPGKIDEDVQDFVRSLGDYGLLAEAD